MRGRALSLDLKKLGGNKEMQMERWNYFKLRNKKKCEKFRVAQMTALNTFWAEMASKDGKQTLWRAADELPK